MVKLRETFCAFDKAINEVNERRMQGGSLDVCLLLMVCLIFTCVERQRVEEPCKRTMKATATAVGN